MDDYDKITAISPMLDRVGEQIDQEQNAFQTQTPKLEVTVTTTVDLPQSVRDSFEYWLPPGTPTAYEIGPDQVSLVATYDMGSASYGASTEGGQKLTEGT